MKHKLVGKMMTEFAVLRSKTYSNLTNDNEEKRTKGTKKMCHKAKTQI